MTDRQTIGELLERQAAENPHRRFLTFTDSGLELTFDKFNREVNRAAHGLAGVGVRRGETVGLMLPNSAEYLVVSYALKKIGALEVGINRDYDASQLAHKLGRVKPEWIIVDHADAAATEVMAHEIGPFQSIVVGAKSTPRAGLRYDDVLTDDETNPIIPPGPDTAASMILLSSGTTGVSKGIVTSHRMGMRVAEGLASAYDIGAADCVYAPWPLHHGTASFCDVLTALLTASRAVVAPRFSARQFWPDVRAHGATWLSTIGIVQKILWNMEPTPDDRDHSLRFMWGGPLPIDRDQFRARFGIATSLSYGSSEIGLATFQSLDDRDPPKSCGPVRADLYDLKIIDDGGTEIPAGEVGEIVCRPREEGLITAGYLGMDDLTAAVIRDGWFHTGDYGYLDADGCLYFIERRDAMIRHRGENIAPADIEAIVEQHPGIAECAVLGVPSDMGEYDVVAFVELQPGTEVTPVELSRFCGEHGPRWMIPSQIQIVPEVPKTSTGKPSIADLRDLHNSRA